MRRTACVLVVALASACLPGLPAGSVAADPAAPEPPEVGLVTTPTHEKNQILRGTKQASTAIDINGKEVVALDDDTVWSVAVDLTDGTNVLGVQTRDALGQRSLPVDVVILVDTDPPLPPVLDEQPPARTQDPSVTLRGSVGPSERLVLDGDVVPLTTNTFSVDVPLPVLGDNLIRLAARDDAGNESDVLELHVDRAGVDTAAPVIADEAPGDLVPAEGAVVRDIIGVVGVETDASPTVSVEVCAGDDCPGGTHTTTLTADADGTFSGPVDVSDLPDDAPLLLTLRAVDEWGNATDPVIERHLVRAAHPATVAAVTPGTPTLAAGDAPFDVDVAWVDTPDLRFAAGTGPTVAYAPAPSTLATGVRLTTVAARPRGGTTEVAFADATSVKLALVASATTETALDSATVTSLDLAATADAGGAVLAVIDDGLVEVTARTAPGSWTSPVVVSDGVTAVGSGAPDDVHVAALADGNVVVTWRETSARDGADDDADVVAVLAAPATGPLAAPLVVSADGASFVDGSATHAPRIASLDTSVAIGFLEGVDAYVSVLDEAALTAGTAPEPAPVASDVDELAVAASSDTVAVATRGFGAGAHVVVAAGAPDALAALPASARVDVPDSTNAGPPAIALAGRHAHVAFASGAAVAVYPLEVSP